MAIDVTSEESVAAAAKEVEQRHGRLDVLVNNAGITGPMVAVVDTGAIELLACYDTNVLGPVRVTRAFLPLLRRSAAPRIVMVSSGLGSITNTSEPGRLESSLVADPGYTATDLNDHSGRQTVEEGSDAIVALATVAGDGPTGGFFDRTGPVPW